MTSPAARAARAALTTLLLAAPSAALAVPMQGVEQTIRRGFFTETDLGTYFDFKTSNGFGVSNAQAYLQLGVGYDITEHISVGVQFGLGANAALCFGATANDGSCGQVDEAGNLAKDPTTGASLVLPDNFSNTFIQGQITYYLPIIPRLVFAPRLLLGYQALNPAPIVNADGNPVSGGFMVGTDLAIE